LAGIGAGDVPKPGVTREKEEEEEESDPDADAKVTVERRERVVRKAE
jgi:hypothetical protein